MRVSVVTSIGNQFTMENVDSIVFVHEGSKVRDITHPPDTDIYTEMYIIEENTATVTITYADKPALSDVEQAAYLAGANESEP